MSQSDAAINLSQLDTERPATPDPAVWSANVAALTKNQPELADHLQTLSLPETWRPAWALDDSPTYRLEQSGEPPTWLGGSAAPRLRAESSLAGFTSIDRNVALPCLGAGAELVCLLRQLPAHVAIFVFESDLRVLAAVLRLHDLAAHIADGRCVLVPAEREAEFLSAELEAHPGLLPPANIVLPNLVSSERVGALKGLCERVGRATNLRRRERLAQLTIRAGAASVVEPRLAVLALQPRRAAHDVAGCLERAGRRLGWEVRCCMVSGPRSVDGLVHCESLHDFKPSMTLCVNHLPSALPLRTPGVACAWFLDEQGIPAEIPDDGTVWLAGSPRIATALRDAVASPQRVREFHAACESCAASDRADDNGDADDGVLLFGDLPDDRPESHGVDQATHQLLWRKLREQVGALWDAPRALDAGHVLVRAQRDSAVELGDETLRAGMVQLIERVLAPAAVLEHIARALVREGLSVRTIGRGWERLAAEGVTPLVGELCDLSDRGGSLRPRVCIFAGRSDSLTPALLEAAGHGWPLLVHRPGGQDLNTALGGVLRAGAHFEPFRDTRELRRALQLMRDTSPTVRRRAEAAQRHVLEQHSYEQRLRELGALLDDLGR